jgi:Fe-S-cluster-containing dehydrogenase component/formate-dependent nitrite reductase membrane component NrfD
LRRKKEKGKSQPGQHFCLFPFAFRHSEGMTMPTFGFVIDNRKCIGCHACTVACKSEHEVPVGVDRTWVKYIEKGTFPNNRRLFTVMRCNHCEFAPCVTICPVTALHTRGDGVVDFNSDRCIGCKACMQACPYDSIYINPETNTAAKCNFCTHRLEIGLQPSCVVVCPEQAIIAGDMDDPLSEITKLLGSHPVTVRKPEKGTKPKLFYIDADEASLVPTAAATDGRGMWSRGEFVNTDGTAAVPKSLPAEERAAHEVSGRLALPVVGVEAAPRRAYDVRPRAPAWGWEVVAYTWTKAIGTGAFLAVVAARLLAGPPAAARIAVAMGVIALIFLALTGGLLIADLKQPKRFLYVLLRPQWRSWLVRGAYGITGFGAVLTLWLGATLAGFDSFADVLLWPGAALAVFSAVYTAFLFAQAKGRDFWQNPLLSVHLLAHALLAGAAVWLIAEVVSGGDATTAGQMLAATLIFSAIALYAEIWTTHPTTDARMAMDWILGPKMGRWFWGAGVGVGHVLPLVLLATGFGPAGVLAAVAALAGMYVIEWLWVLAPQQVPLS